MGFYARRILPHLIDCCMSMPVAAAERAKFVPLARGTVLEIGIGSGLNIPYYAADLTRLYGLDPAAELRAIAEPRAAAAPFPVEFIGLSAETIPLADRAVDSIVTTWTLCSIPAVDIALAEMRRVLRPEGRLIFIEHGLSPDPGVRRWQSWLNPLQRRLAGGCNLNRRIDALIAAAGFHIEGLETAYVRGPRPWCYFYKGVARRA